MAFYLAEQSRYDKAEWTTLFSLLPSSRLGGVFALERYSTSAQDRALYASRIRATFNVDGSRRKQKVG